jgi:hypothetical protein
LSMFLTSTRTFHAVFQAFLAEEAHGNCVVNLGYYAVIPASAGMTT